MLAQAYILHLSCTHSTGYAMLHNKSLPNLPHIHCALIMDLYFQLQNMKRSSISCLSGTLQADQPTDHDARAGAPTDYIQFRPPEQALNSSPHTWAQPPLLLHRHQLQVQPSLLSTTATAA